MITAFRFIREPFPAPCPPATGPVETQPTPGHFLFNMKLQAGTAPSMRAVWANLYDLRNHLAHSRHPDIDESLVRRFTWARLDSLQATMQHHLRTRP
jgi:hypothetical protein